VRAQHRITTERLGFLVQQSQLHTDPNYNQRRSRHQQVQSKLWPLRQPNGVYRPECGIDRRDETAENHKARSYYSGVFAGPFPGPEPQQDAD
jgi:hypothetical protein